MNEKPSVLLFDQVLFQQVRQLWLSRGALLLLMNHHKSVNAAVSSYSKTDTEFKTAMEAFRKESKTLGIESSFNYISGQISLISILRLEVPRLFVWRCLARKPF